MTDKDAFGEWLSNPSGVPNKSNRENLYDAASEGVNGARLEELLRGAFVDGVWYGIMVDERYHEGEANAT
tara:strand:- start:686 stop:895 length:210 start_codon:yes stop_codon:yes gene_type:complete